MKRWLFLLGALLCIGIGIWALAYTHRYSYSLCLVDDPNCPAPELFWEKPETFFAFSDRAAYKKAAKKFIARKASSSWLRENPNLSPKYPAFFMLESSGGLVDYSKDPELSAELGELSEYMLSIPNPLKK